MDFYAILDAGRSHYLERYRHAIVDYRNRFMPSSPEVTLDRTGSSDPLPYRYYRLDLASGAVSPPDLTEVNVDPHEPLEPTAFVLESGVRVTLSTFVWNGVEFASSVTPSETTWLERWTERWLDVNDTRPADTDGLSGVIHSVTCPTLGARGWSFSVDFGSAPLEAVRELVASLYGAGLRYVQIGSFHLEQEG